MWASLRLQFLQQCLRNERHHGVYRFQRGKRELLPLCWKWELAAGARESSPSPFFMHWMSRDELPPDQRELARPYRVEIIPFLSTPQPSVQTTCNVNFGIPRLFRTLRDSESIKQALAGLAPER